MEFGRVSVVELNKIDLSLPPEPAWNDSILNAIPVSQPKIYLGCAKWGKPEWIGKLYPLKTRERNFLDHYVQHFNSIELNITHYKIYGERGTQKWAAKAAGMDFKFCPKMYQGVTHSGKLGNKQFLSNEFLRGIRGLGEHLGPIFIQVDERFSPNRRDELFKYLTGLPKDLEFFMEVRHHKWFSDKKIADEYFSFLKENNIGAIITDTAGRRDCVHMHLTIPKAFIRFVGNSLHPTDYKRCDEWAVKIKNWIDKGIEEVYFFLHMQEEDTLPDLSAYMVKRLEQLTGILMKMPGLIGQEKSPVDTK